MTFGAPIEALFGPEISLPPPTRKRAKLELEESTLGGAKIPHVLQV